MEYGLFAIAMIGVLLAHLELTKWKERVRAQQKQIDELCRAIGREALSADTVPDEVREKALRLLRRGMPSVHGGEEICDVYRIGL